MHIRRLYAIVLSAGVFLMAPRSLWAQIQTGSIPGTVADTSGAVVPDATVTATAVGTNVSRIATTSSEGYYSIPNLTPGIYKVSAEKSGFKKAIRENIQLLVASSVVADFKLELGQVTQTVTVTAQAAAVSTTTADRGTNVRPTTLEELPLEISGSARQVDSFVFLTPGVVGNTFQTRVNGADFDQEISLDGLPWLNADEGGSFLQFRPPFESIGEFKVGTNAYSAQYGRGTGLEIFNFRSGTNELCGHVFEFFRNNALDAGGFFNPAVSIEKQSEFGFRVGGPIYLPHVYDGRNRTFFHFTYGGFRFRGGVRNTLATFPTAKMLQGDFSELREANGNLIPIYDPVTTRPDARPISMQWSIKRH